MVGYTLLKNIYINRQLALKVSKSRESLKWNISKGDKYISLKYITKLAADNFVT